MTDIVALFNPRPRILRQDFPNGQSCLVIDDALLQPELLRQYAADHRTDFFYSGLAAYPGIELPMPDDFNAQLDAFFMRHVRSLLGARRTLRMYSRLAMVTTPPEKLLPRQSICHRDGPWITPGQTIAASVLYLFEDASLGGTNFYAPKVSQREADLLVHDASTMDSEAFAGKHGIAPGYMAGSNDYFERIGNVPAKWNRMIFYDGRIFHSGEVGSPLALNGDPMTGRLTLNGFFTCSRKAA